MAETTEKMTEALDSMLNRMEAAVTRVDELQGKAVKLRKAETDLLQTFEEARDFMMKVLQMKDPGREALMSMFGGDCVRIARIRECLERSVLSDMYATDERKPQCLSACESVEKVLDDLGLGWALRKAQEDQKKLQQSRKSLAGGSAEAVAAESSEVTVEPVVIEAPQPKIEKKELDKEAHATTIDEDLIARILACTDAADLLELEPDKKEKENWMIWMVHRAYLDDPTLVKFDFTNLQMPPGDVEPRISPKLAEAIKSNSHIEQLLLPNTNLQTKQAGVLAESLKSNAAIRVLNLDSNLIQLDEMESIANAVGVNQTIEELRVNNQHGLMLARSHFEAFANACKANKMLCKLGLNITDPTYRNDIDRSIMRNNDDARKRRNAAKKAAEAAAAAA